jgi:hypothetical protein
MGLYAFWLRKEGNSGLEIHELFVAQRKKKKKKKDPGQIFFLTY